MLCLLLFQVLNLLNYMRKGNYMGIQLFLPVKNLFEIFGFHLQVILIGILQPPHDLGLADLH